MLLSIIIPVYNIENYIGACIKSVLDQNLDSDTYEILIIDDGSKDGSSKIVADFEAQHENITVFRQENVGLGGARKAGLKLAKGKYLYFLDGDDYLARNTLKQVVDAAEKHNLDITGFKIQTTKRLDLEKSEYSALDKPIEVSDGITFIAQNENYTVEVWWYIIKREFFDAAGLIFEDKRFVNDSYFTPSLFTKAKRVALLPIDIYRYVQRPGSITSSKSPAHFRKHIGDLEFAIFQMEDIMNGIKEHPYKEGAIKTITVKQESYVFFSIVRFFKSDLKKSYLKDLLEKYRRLNCYPMRTLTDSREYGSLKYKLITAVFNNRFTLGVTTVLIRFFFRLKRALF
jgi:glycosyltransferase involved in cell wall biosynthesis